MKPDLARIRSIAAVLLHHLRHPTRRGILLALAIPPALLFLYVLALIPFTPAISDIRKAKSEQPAQILSADGKELALFKRANRDWVKLNEISPQVVAALIATEDHRFFQHHGIDWRRTISAALHTASGDRQGGSTLTQQLARNLYPEEIGRSPTFTRKLKEAITALKIEAVYSKNEILETYLNTVPFLYNAYGIEMAARTYFDKSAKTLDILESATLIGMLKGNSYYNPVINPERSLQRRNTVLAQMVRHQKLEAARLDPLKRKPLEIDFERQTEPPGSAPHFAQELRKWLIAWADRNDYNIYADGLVVRTTIDSRLQALANQAVKRRGNQLQALADAEWGARSGWSQQRELIQTFVRETPEYRNLLSSGIPEAQALKRLLADAAFMRELRQQKTRIQAGFLAIDPRNGQVRAWVGSRDFTQDAFDHVQQARRQPGSTFKPFVYGAAFEQGFTPDDTLVDQTVEIRLAGGEIWSPTDGRPPSGRTMPLRDGLAYSKNTITAQLMQKVGPNKVVKLARALGIRQSKLEPVPSLALGTSPVTLKEMVTAYASLAREGKYLEPVMVTRIEDRRGKVLEEFSAASPEAALSPAATEALLEAMRGVIDRGTGTAIRTRYGIHADVAGKTGTTQDNTDGWFILIHSQLVGGAWVGFNDNRITLRSDYWGQGAHSALPIVGDVFQPALRNRLIDPQVRLVPPKKPGLLDRLVSWGGDWFQRFFASAPEPRPEPKRPARPAPAPQPAPVPEEPQLPAELPPAPAEEPAPSPPTTLPAETPSPRTTPPLRFSERLESAPPPTPQPLSPPKPPGSTEPRNTGNGSTPP